MSSDDTTLNDILNIYRQANPDAITDEVTRLAKAADNIEKSAGQPLSGDVATAAASLLRAWAVLLAGDQVGRPGTPERPTGTAEVLRLAEAAMAPAGGRIVQLRDAVIAQGGRWDGKRAAGYYASTGWPVTNGRGKANLDRVAESYPGLLIPVEGEKSTYDVNHGYDRTSRTQDTE